MIDLAADRPGYIDEIARASKHSRFNPAWFYKNILQIKNDPWQLELTEAVVDVERKLRGLPTKINHEGLNKISARAGHGPGKTHWVAGLSHLWQFTRYGRIVVTATKERQILTRFMPEFRMIGNNAIDGYSQFYDATGGKIVWGDDPDYFLIAETAREPENLAGYHHEYLLFIVDEASGIHEGLFPVIEGAISTGKVVVLVMIGNPTKNEGTFYLSHCSAKVSKEYFNYHVSLDKTTRVSKKWVQSMKTKYGEDSSVVKVRCLGEFAEADADQLIPLSWVENCRMDTLIETDGSIPTNYVTADIADGGEDETIIIPIRSYDSFDHYIKLNRFRFKPSIAIIQAGESAMRIAKANFGDDYKKTTVFIVDSVGVGAGTAGHLLDNGCKVIRYKGGKAVLSKDYRNQRSQSYNTYAEALHNKTIKFDKQFCTDDEWEDFYGQTSTIRRDIEAENTDDIETKKKLLSRGLKSPDMPDACMMRYTNISPTAGRKNTPLPVAGSNLQSEQYDGR